MKNEILLMPFKDCIEELKTWLMQDNLKYKNRQEACNAVANYFRVCNPSTEEELENFYNSCDDYIYENAYCNKSPSVQARIKKVYEVVQNYNIKKILEIGIGIGSYSLALSLANIDVSVTRSNNLPFKFFEWRRKKYEAEIKIIDEPQEVYDCIMFFDVIEHISNPFSFLSSIAPYAKSILFTHGFGVHTEKMGGYPQHFNFKIKDIKKHLESLGYKKAKLNQMFPPHLYVKCETNE